MRTGGIGAGVLRLGRSRRVRRGAAVVELAVVTPIMLTMVFGVMEFGWMFMVQETITNATREACRVGVLQGTTEEEIRTRFAEAMENTGVTVTTDTLAIEMATADDPVVTVTASVPYSEVSLGLGSWLGLSDGTLGSMCSMRKEGM